MTEVAMCPEDLLKFVLEEPDLPSNLDEEQITRKQTNIITSEDQDHDLYTFLLGSRLFLSPHQLLTEIQRIAKEEIPLETSFSSEVISTPRGDICRACKRIQHLGQWRRKQARSGGDDVSTPQETNFYSCNISINVPEGEDTIRRRRRGRLRESVTDCPNEESPSPFLESGSDPTSLVSRDSGIVSAYFEDGINVPAPESPKPSGSDQYPEIRVRCLCLRRRLVLVLHEWVRHFPTDFRNKKIMWTLNDVIKSCHGDNEELMRSCTDVMDCVSRGIAAQEHYEQFLSQSDPEKQNLKVRKTRDNIIKYIRAQKDATRVNEFARQLALIEIDLLRHVGTEELMQMFPDDSDDESKSNLGATVRWFNRLSHLVGTIICMCRRRKHARQIITFFARVADRCYQLSNFNTSMAILTGLSYGSVIRLKKTWNKLRLTELVRVQNVFDPSNNFLNYRKIYKERIENYFRKKNENTAGAETNNRLSMISHRSSESVSSTTSLPGDSGVEYDQDQNGKTNSPRFRLKFPSTFQRRKTTEIVIDEEETTSHSEIVVPFLGVLMKDVFFLLNCTTPTTKEDGRINWEKLKGLSKLLRPIEDWKRCQPPYERDEEIQSFLLNTTVWSDDELYLASYKREAPFNQFEKHQYKLLKIKRQAEIQEEVSSAGCVKVKSKTL